MKKIEKNLSELHHTYYRGRHKKVIKFENQHEELVDKWRKRIESIKKGEIKARPWWQGVDASLIPDFDTEKTFMIEDLQLEAASGSEEEYTDYTRDQETEDSIPESQMEMT
eukprot:UN06039